MAKYDNNKFCTVTICNRAGSAGALLLQGTNDNFTVVQSLGYEDDMVAAGIVNINDMIDMVFIDPNTNARTITRFTVCYDRIDNTTILRPCSMGSLTSGSSSSISLGSFITNTQYDYVAHGTLTFTEDDGYQDTTITGLQKGDIVFGSLLAPQGGAKDICFTVISTNTLAAHLDINVGSLNTTAYWVALRKIGV